MEKKITSEAPRNESGLIQMIRMEKSIRHKRVKHAAASLVLLHAQYIARCRQLSFDTPFADIITW